MSAAEPVWVYNRATGEREREVIAGEAFVRFLYESALGRLLADTVFKRRGFSRFYGFLQNLPVRTRRLKKFAAHLEIDLDEAVKPVEAFKTFNEFFSRALKPGARPIDLDPGKVISPCDARLLVIPFVTADSAAAVKGFTFDLETLLHDRDLAARFDGGAMFIYRLCPADYHRFHFPEDGLPGFAETLNGPLHSVNPISLGSGFKVLDTNLRHRTLLDTEDRLGTVAMIEVGAMCVGSVVQTFVPRVPNRRGDEKGLFLFGGSTVIVLYEPGRVKADEDLLEHSRLGVEAIVRLGTAVGYTV
jgi:phosphatidylserine decarboxylase